MCMYMYNYIYSQSFSCRRLLISLFSLSIFPKCFCLTQQFYKKACIWIYHYNTHQLSSLLSHFSPSCLPPNCCFYTLVLFTYFDVRARLSISDFRLPSNASFRPEDHTDWERAPPSYDYAGGSGQCKTLNSPVTLKWANIEFTSSWK